MNYVNFSMERYDFINHRELHNHTVYSQFFDKKVNYDNEIP